MSLFLCSLFCLWFTERALKTIYLLSSMGKDSPPLPSLFMELLGAYLSNGYANTRIAFSWLGTPPLYRLTELSIYRWMKQTKR